MDGLGVDVLAHAALSRQQDGSVAGGHPLGEGLAGHRLLAPGHDGVEGVFGLADAVQHLPSPLLRALEQLLKGGGIILEGDHRHAPQQRGAVVGEDGVHVHIVHVLHLLAGLLQDGPSRPQHLRQPGAGPQVPEIVTGDVADILAAALPVQEAPVGLVAEDDHTLRVDDEDALPHGVENLPQLV